MRSLICLLAAAATIGCRTGTLVQRPATAANPAPQLAPRIRTATLSPDSGLVAFEAEESASVAGEVWLVGTAAESKPRRLAVGVSPTWSFDGQMLAFMVPDGDGFQIALWDRRADRVRRVTSVRGGIRPNFYASEPRGTRREALRLSWSPDSRSIAFAGGIPLTREDSSGVAIVLTADTPAPRLFAGIIRHAFIG